MDFIPKNISEYSEHHTAAEPGYLYELNRYTHTSVLQPRMLSGHLQGRMLSMFSKLVQPAYILEIGTYTGYSALCLAEGLQTNGILHTIEIDEELKPLARKYFDRSPYGANIRQHIGNAAVIIPELNRTVPHWDLVFVDADKLQYPLYFDLVVDTLRPGGIIIADNVLWSGKVTDPHEVAGDPETLAIDSFNKKVSTDPRVEAVLLPVRDGLMVLRKL